MEQLLRIVVSEEMGVKQWLLRFLWEKGFPGLTIRQSEMSLDERGLRHVSVLEDQLYNDLALIIETVADETLITSILPQLKERLKHGQICVTNGLEGDKMNEHRYYTVKVYTKEDNTWFKKEEYEKVLLFFQEKNAIWTSMTKGIAGYGRNRVIHTQKMFSLSGKIPVVIECVVKGDYLNQLLAELKTIVEEGTIFTTPVHLIENK
ncbi:MAG: DUF190 domain-containing protein [Sporolactobacillus sp.]|uniref:DUF190 domain-containing protein n=1 Tax=Sporolactobacillus sp. STSJ-5 TaxID=2965076 RepID=UPI0021075CFB|nr:DUF190 domain-containing protein [Sporolactobacillus sp. STSJ-5]MCQ2010263.1 DUF190 domain-containing protein [Sporolactobacillus sp. STSJ-5]